MKKRMPKIIKEFSIEIPLDYFRKWAREGAEDVLNSLGLPHDTMCICQDPGCGKKHPALEALENGLFDLQRDVWNEAVQRSAAAFMAAYNASRQPVTSQEAAIAEAEAEAILARATGSIQ